MRRLVTNSSCFLDKKQYRGLCKLAVEFARSWDPVSSMRNNQDGQILHNFLVQANTNLPITQSNQELFIIAKSVSSPLLLAQNKICPLIPC